MKKENTRRKKTLGKIFALATLWSLGAHPPGYLGPKPAVALQELPTDNQKIGDFISTMGREAIQILTNKKLTNAERFSGFKKILLKNFDLKGIGDYLVGGSSDRWTESQRNEYSQVLPDYIVRLYLTKFENNQDNTFTDETFKVNRVFKKDSTNSQSPYFVKTTITVKGSEPLDVDWKVFDTVDGPKILDVSFNALSMCQTKKEEFLTILNSKNSQNQNVDALLKVLREKSTQTSKKN